MNDGNGPTQVMLLARQMASFGLTAASIGFATVRPSYGGTIRVGLAANEDKIGPVLA